MLTFSVSFVQYFRQAIPRFNKHPLNAEQDAAVNFNPHPATFIVGCGRARERQRYSLCVSSNSCSLTVFDRPALLLQHLLARPLMNSVHHILAWGYATIEAAYAACAGNPQLQEWLSQLDVDGVSVWTLDSFSKQSINNNHHQEESRYNRQKVLLQAALITAFGFSPPSDSRSKTLNKLLRPSFPRIHPGRCRSSLTSHSASLIDYVHDEIDLSMLLPLRFRASGTARCHRRLSGLS